MGERRCAVKICFISFLNQVCCSLTDIWALKWFYSISRNVINVDDVVPVMFVDNLVG